MEDDWLIKAAAKPFGKKTALALTQKILKEQYPAEELIAHCFHPVKELAFRAAWLFEHAVERSPQWFIPATACFTDRYPAQGNLSCRRHFARVMSHITNSNSGKIFHHQLQGIDMQKVIDATFEWLVQPGAPVAVMVNCLDVLYNLRHENDWIAGEIQDHIPFLMLNGSAALQSRGSKILEKLK